MPAICRNSLLFREINMHPEVANQFSDEIKIAILCEENKIVIEHRNRSEKSRRNHMIAVFVALFFGSTGLFPSKFDAFGIHIEQFPSAPFYVFLSVLVIYMYWSYQTHRKTASISRQIVNCVYDEVIGYDYRGLVSRFVSRGETNIYLLWQRYMPLFVSIAAILICLARAFYEAFYRVPSP